MAEPVKQEGVYAIAKREFEAAMEDNLSELPSEVAYRWGILHGIEFVFDDMDEEFGEDEAEDEETKEV